MYIIYKLTNTANQKGYIGFTSLSLEKRWAKHLRDAKYGRDTILCNAIRKNGAEAFSKEILFESDDLQETLNTMESEMIAQYKTHMSQGGYNMTMGGEGTIGHSHSHSTRAKMKRSHTGCTHTDATKKLLSQQRTGSGNPNFGKKLSDEQKIKISKAVAGDKNGRAKTYKATLPNGETQIVTDRRKFCDLHGLRYYSLADANRKGKAYNGYYLEPMDYACNPVTVPQPQ